MILFSQLSFIFHFPCSHFQVTNIPSSEQSTTPFPSIYCLILCSFALNAYTCETNWKESLVQTLLHLSKLWPRVWFSCLLPPNQRLLGQRHDKLSIRAENSINYLGHNSVCTSKSLELWSNECIPLLACWTCVRWRNPGHHAQMGSRSILMGSNMNLSIWHRHVTLYLYQMKRWTIAYHIQQPVISLHRLVEPDPAEQWQATIRINKILLK